MLGLALLATAIAANQAWLDRHFLPSFLMPRHWYVRLETTVRVCIAVFGVSLVLTRQRLARYVDRRAGRAGSILLAGVLGLGASEWFLGRVHLRPTEWLLPEEEPRRRVDPRLGWVLEPARVGRTRAGGRAIEYAIDPSGYRVRRVDEPVDPLRPTVLFTGESVMFGEGLGSDETIPEQAGMMLGVQPANLAVHGYSTDQAYLRLVTELPRFQRPVAVVTLFMTALLGRNLDDDRPHLGPDLVWRPAVPNSRLAALAGFLVPFRKDKTVDDGVRTTREVLRATVDLARSRGATPLIVVPQIGRESPPEAAFRRRILEAADVPYVLVELDPAWHVPWDRHPDARAARLIARAIVDRLRVDLR